MIRRVERLENRIRLKPQQLQFVVYFIEPDGTVASTLLLGSQDDQGHKSYSGGTSAENAASPRNPKRPSRPVHQSPWS
jgi:hypothetical protein